MTVVPLLLLSVAAPFKVWLTVETKTPAGLERVQEGARLVSGQKFQMRVKVDRPAYVYAVQFFADGTSAVLYPKDHDVRVKPGAELRLPPEGYWFELDDAVGREDIYLIASARPIEQVDAKTAEVLKKVKKDGSKKQKKKKKKKKRKARPPPKKIPKSAVASAEQTYAGGLTMRTRGVKIVADDEAGGEPPAVQADKDGVAVMRFSFDHVAR